MASTGATAMMVSDPPNDLFMECRPKELAAIRHLCSEVAVAPGRVLLRQGQPGRQFLVISAGRARVELDGVLLGHVDAGSFVGEMALLERRPCIATVTAITPMHLLVFGRSEFRTLMALGIPSVMRRMLLTIEQRLRSADVRLTA